MSAIWSVKMSAISYVLENLTYSCDGYFYIEGTLSREGAHALHHARGQLFLDLMGLLRRRFGDNLIMYREDGESI